MIDTPDSGVWKRAYDRASACPVIARLTSAFDSHMDSSRIIVIGVGGAGVNTVARLADTPVPGVGLLAVDTSAQTILRVGALDPTARSGGSRAEIARTTHAQVSDVSPILADRPTGALSSILLARGTRGLGAGGDASKAAEAARADTAAISEALRGAGIVFVVAGLAGGTGGGAAPIVAQLAREAGAVTLGFGILPFAFETKRRHAAASIARAALSNACHTTVDLDNERAVDLAGSALWLEAALRVADDAVRQAVAGLSALIGVGGWIDVDVARALEILRMQGEGCVALGSARVDDGEGTSDRPALSALRMALDSPFGGMCRLSKARAAMLQVCGGPELAIADVADAADIVKRRLPVGSELFVGASSLPSLRGVARVTLLGTGIGSAQSGRWSGDSEPTQSTDARSLVRRIAPSAATGFGTKTRPGRPLDRDRHDPRPSNRGRNATDVPGLAAARAV